MSAPHRKAAVPAPEPTSETRLKAAAPAPEDMHTRIGHPSDSEEDFATWVRGWTPATRGDAAFDVEQLLILIHELRDTLAWSRVLAIADSDPRAQGAREQIDARLADLHEIELAVRQVGERLICASTCREKPMVTACLMGWLQTLMLEGQAAARRAT